MELHELAVKAERNCRLRFWSRTIAVWGGYLLCNFLMFRAMLAQAQARMSDNPPNAGTLITLLLLTGVPLFMVMFVVEIYAIQSDREKAQARYGLACVKCGKPLLVNRSTDYTYRSLSELASECLKRGGCYHCGTSWRRERKQKSSNKADNDLEKLQAEYRSMTQGKKRDA